MTSSDCGCAAACGCTTSAQALDPATGADPRLRLRFNDGALLDARDLRVEQNAHLWRDRLHNVLLHGAGVIWGLGVEAIEDGRVLRVAPGAAIDARGRLLLLDRELCLDLWRLPAGFAGTLPEIEGGRRAAVVLSFEACVAEPVSALRPVCSEPPATSWHRQVDAARVDLAAELPEEPIATLRRWLDRRGTAPQRGPGRWLGAPPTPADVRATLLELSIAEAGELPSIWSDDHPVPLLLATVDLAPAVPSGVIATAIDPSGRSLLPPVQLIAEWLLGTELASGPSALPSAVRVVGMQIGGGSVTLTLSGPLDPTSVTAGAAELLAFTGGAWTAVAATPSAAGDTLTLTPTTPPAAGTPVQIALHGTGAAALIGAAGEPFAGDGPPSTLPRAHDLVLVATWS